MGGFNFISCVAENFIKTVGFDFIVSNANDFIKNSESSTLSTKNIKTSFLYPTDNKGIGFFPVPFFCILKRQRDPNSSPLPPLKSEVGLAKAGRRDFLGVYGI